MKIAKRPDPELLHVVAASLRVWLLDVCVWLSDWLGVQLPRDIRMDLRRDLARALRETRMLVFLLAVSRMRIPVLAPRRERPGSTPRGCRRARRACSAGRVFNRGLKLRGRTLAGKLAALHDVLDDLEGAARRMLKHLRRRPGAIALVLAGPVVERLRGRALCAPAGMDTS